MKELPVNEHVSFSDYPHLDYDGKRFVKELEYQIFESEVWTDTERIWWNYMRNRFLACMANNEMSVKDAFMRGVEYANQMADSPLSQDLISDGYYLGEVKEDD